MVRTLRISALAVILFGLNGGTGMLPSNAGQPPEQVTSDTLIYCRQLAQRVDQLAVTSTNPPEQVTNLEVAGKDMCEHGSIRAGILRLRSAMVLLMHPPSDASSPSVNPAE